MDFEACSMQRTSLSKMTSSLAHDATLDDEDALMQGHISKFHGCKT